MGRVEELGSGILTTSRLTKEYAAKGKAVFIEGETFRTIIPLPYGKAILINDTINDTVKKRMVGLIQELIKQPGLKSKDLAKIAGVWKYQYAGICRNLPD